MDTTLLRNNPFLSATREGPGYQPRPKSGDGAYRFANAEQLAESQKQWDAAEQWAQHNDKLRADRIAQEEAERKAVSDAAIAEDAARRLAARDQLEAELRRSFLANPAATEADWTRSKDAIVGKHLEAQAVTRNVRLRNSLEDF